MIQGRIARPRANAGCFFSINQNDMKRTHIIALLAAAFFSSHAFAVVGTALKGGVMVSDTEYQGGETTKVDLYISAEGETDCSNITVYGHYGQQPETFSSVWVGMLGGMVKQIYGVYSSSGDTNRISTSILIRDNSVVKGNVVGIEISGGNIISGPNVSITGSVIEGEIIGGKTSSGKSETSFVVVSGGEAKGITGGATEKGNADLNTVVVSDNCSIDGNLIGGKSTDGSATKNAVTVCGAVIGGNLIIAQAGGKGVASKNNLTLAGQGGTAEDEEGGSITIKGNILVSGGVSEKSSGNSIDIYGTDITAGAVMGIQILNFHIVKGQLDSAVPMLTLTSEDQALDLTNFLSCNATTIQDYSLNFDAVEAMDWQPGQSVTLVSSALELKVNPELLSKEYDIKIHGKDTVTATATLELSEDGKQLLLVRYGNVPEPTTGTLSLLALAALAARRRGK